MRVFRSLGRFTLVAGPVLVLLVFVLAAFLMWVLVTAPGSRWALTTAVEAAGGRVQAIEGSVWNGLRVGELDVDTPAVALRFEGLTLQADWRRLLERQLHVHTLRADTLWVDLKPADDTATEDAATEPFSGADLPVSVRVDALAVGELILSQHGRPLPYTIGGFSSAVSVGPERAQFCAAWRSVATASKPRWRARYSFMRCSTRGRLRWISTLKCRGCARLHPYAFAACCLHYPVAPPPPTPLPAYWRGLRPTPVR